MDKPALPSGLIAQIKETTRRMVLAAGGDAAVEALLGVSRGQISKWKLDHHPDLIPVWAIAAIAFAKKDTTFAAFLAELVSHQVVPVVAEVPSGDSADADFVGDLVGLQRSGGAMKSALGDALEDRHVSPSEAKQVLHHIGRHRQTLARTEQRLSVIAARSA